jgi:hypothetical protein
LGRSARTWEEIAGWIKDFIDFANFSKSDKAAADHATDFDPPLYNIWKQRHTGPAGFSGARTAQGAAIALYAALSALARHGIDRLGSRLPT